MHRTTCRSLRATMRTLSDFDVLRLARRGRRRRRWDPSATPTPLVVPTRRAGDRRSMAAADLRGLDDVYLVHACCRQAFGEALGIDDRRRGRARPCAHDPDAGAPVICVALARADVIPARARALRAAVAGRARHRVARRRCVGAGRAAPSAAPTRRAALGAALGLDARSSACSPTRSVAAPGCRRSRRCAVPSGGTTPHPRAPLRRGRAAARQLSSGRRRRRAGGPGGPAGSRRSARSARP